MCYTVGTLRSAGVIFMGVLVDSPVSMYNQPRRFELPSVRLIKHVNRYHIDVLKVIAWMLSFFRVHSDVLQ